MHPTIRRARDLLARLDQQEIDHQVWREQHADALEIAEIDALLAEPAAIKQRDFNDVIYKRRDDARVQPQPFMDPEQQVAWDRWCASRIRAAIEEAAQVIGQEVGGIERGLKADIDRRFAELYASVAQLRLEIETLRAATKKGKANAAGA